MTRAGRTAGGRSDRVGRPSGGPALAKDYYFILGVPRAASARSIRSAFRQLAKKLHPDHAGPQAAGAFRDVVEAYEVLSDPALRQAYNASLRDRPAREEPLVSPRQPPSWAPRPERVFDKGPGAPPAPRTMQSLLEALRAAWGLAEPRPVAPGQLHAEVVLSSREAWRGMVVHVRVPVPSPCPACGGRACLRCGGQGLFLHEESVAISIPARTRSGDTIDVVLRGLLLRLHLQVET